MFNISNPKRENLKEIHTLIKRSIRELCFEDHQDNPEHYEGWLDARSEEWIKETIFEPETQGFIILINGSIAGISHIKKEGLITLCYVHPNYIGKGVGQMLMELVEKAAVDWRLPKITLTATATAKPFYEKNGYVELPVVEGIPGFPMYKKLNRRC